jgi:TolA-binding protein
MNSETSDTMKTLSGSTAGTAAMDTSGAAGSAAMENAVAGNVQRVAQKAHEAVDRLEHSLSSGTGRVMDWQQEYGEIAREQVRANPLAVVVGAFALGYVLAKLTR